MNDTDIDEAKAERDEMWKEILEGEKQKSYDKGHEDCNKMWERSEEGKA